MPIILGRKPGGGGGSVAGVTSIAESGQPALTGAVTLSEGANVTLTQVGQDIEVAAAGGGVGTLYDYVERTTDLTVTGTSSGTATTWITGNPVVYDGATKILIEVWAQFGQAQAGDLRIEIWDGVLLGEMSRIRAGNYDPVNGMRIMTPSAGSHTIVVKAWRDTADAFIFAASPALPAFLRITGAP